MKGANSTSSRNDLVHQNQKSISVESKKKDLQGAARIFSLSLPNIVPYQIRTANTRQDYKKIDLRSQNYCLNNFKHDKKSLDKVLVENKDNYQADRQEDSDEHFLDAFERLEMDEEQVNEENIRSKDLHCNSSMRCILFKEFTSPRKINKAQNDCFPLSKPEINYEIESDSTDLNLYSENCVMASKHDKMNISSQQNVISENKDKSNTYYGSRWSTFKHLLQPGINSADRDNLNIDYYLDTQDKELNQMNEIKCNIYNSELEPNITGSQERKSTSIDNSKCIDGIFVKRKVKHSDNDLLKNKNSFDTVTYGSVVTSNSDPNYCASPGQDQGFMIFTASHDSNSKSTNPKFSTMVSSRISYPTESCIAIRNCSFQDDLVVSCGNICNGKKDISFSEKKINHDIGESYSYPEKLFSMPSQHGVLRGSLYGGMRRPARGSHTSFQRHSVGSTVDNHQKYPMIDRGMRLFSNRSLLVSRERYPRHSCSSISSLDDQSDGDSTEYHDKRGTKRLLSTKHSQVIPNKEKHIALDKSYMHSTPSKELTDWKLQASAYQLYHNTTEIPKEVDEDGYLGFLDPSQEGKDNYKALSRCEACPDCSIVSTAQNKMVNCDDSFRYDKSRYAAIAAAYKKMGNQFNESSSPESDFGQYSQKEFSKKNKSSREYLQEEEQYVHAKIAGNYPVHEYDRQIYYAEQWKRESYNSSRPHLNQYKDIPHEIENQIKQRSSVSGLSSIADSYCDEDSEKGSGNEDDDDASYVIPKNRDKPKIIPSTNCIDEPPMQTMIQKARASTERARLLRRKHSINSVGDCNNFACADPELRNATPLSHFKTHSGDVTYSMTLKNVTNVCCDLSKQQGFMSKEHQTFADIAKKGIQHEKSTKLNKNFGDSDSESDTKTPVLVKEITVQMRPKPRLNLQVNQVTLEEDEIESRGSDLDWFNPKKVDHSQRRKVKSETNFVKTMKRTNHSVPEGTKFWKEGYGGNYADSDRSQTPHISSIPLQKQIHKMQSQSAPTNSKLCGSRNTTAVVEDRLCTVRWRNWKDKYRESYQGITTPFVDTHCHIDFLFDRCNFAGTYTKYRKENAETFLPNYDGCVSIFCNPRTFNVNNALWKSLLKEDGVYMAIGCHPKSATDYSPKHEYGMKQMLKQRDKVVAVGEIGLDYSGSFSQHSDIQKIVLRKQCQIAMEESLPIVVHSRDSEQDICNILAETIPGNYKIHRHCFTGTWEEADNWLRKFPNSFIGLTPLITWYNNDRAQGPREVARRIPLNKLLLETDTPYFVPRGIPKDDVRFSHPGYAITVASEVARIKGIPLEIVLKECRKNTRNMYNI